MNKTAQSPDPSENWARSPADEDIADILARLQKTDFAAMTTKDMSVHARVMIALLNKIVHKHDMLVKLRDEVEARTRACIVDREAANLERIIADLHQELTPAPPARRPRWRLFAPSLPNKSRQWRS